MSSKCWLARLLLVSSHHTKSPFLIHPSRLTSRRVATEQEKDQDVARPAINICSRAADSAALLSLGCGCDLAVIVNRPCQTLFFSISHSCDRT